MEIIKVENKNIPDETRKRIEDAGEDSVKVGIEIRVVLIEQVKSLEAGIYIMPQFQKFDMVAEIIEAIR